MTDLDVLDLLGARERQIMLALFRRGSATVAQVLADLPSPPSYSAVRGMLALLEQKGLVGHERDGLRYVYAASFPAGKVKRRALKSLLATFFRGSPERAVSALLGLDEDTPIDLDRLRKAAVRSRGER